MSGERKLGIGTSCSSYRRYLWDLRKLKSDRTFNGKEFRGVSFM
ncbi:MAG TPA: hypothetical protein V6D35_02325 [Candidatus Sericytochromatia bacterium]